MLRSLLIAAAALAAISGPAQAAGSDFRLEIPGSGGEASSQNNLKQLALAGALRGCQGESGPGRTTISGPELSTSRSLAAAVSAGTQIPRAKLFGRKSGGGNETFNVELTNVLISSAQPVRPGAALPQTLTLSYAAMSWTAEGGGC